MTSWKRLRLILKDGSSAIERSLLKSRSETRGRRSDNSIQRGAVDMKRNLLRFAVTFLTFTIGMAAAALTRVFRPPRLQRPERSEERRVGKECRTRVVTYE